MVMTPEATCADGVATQRTQRPPATSAGMAAGSRSMHSALLSSALAVTAIPEEVAAVMVPHGSVVVPTAGERRYLNGTASSLESVVVEIGQTSMVTVTVSVESEVITPKATR